jgi:hypothetical protein
VQEYIIVGAHSSATFDITATNPQPEEGETHWDNIIIKAADSCEAIFDYDISCENECQCDFDDDGNVYPSDLSVFLGEYGRTDCLTTPPPCEADFDDDGNVYPSDLSVFLGEYGRTDCLTIP